MPITIIILFLAAFCIGTTEFVIAGLLPEISNDLGISIPISGYLISAYAAAVAIGGPAMVLATARLPRKTNLLFLMSIFIAGHVWCALASDFTMLMIGRVVVAFSHGSFFGVAGVMAVSIVPENRRGAAIAWLFGGITVANILGVPGGTVIGHWLGWRATFWVVGGLGIAVLIAMITALPKGQKSTDEEAGLGAQFSALANQTVLLSYLAFASMLIGFWAFFTFIAQYLLTVVSIALESLPAMLFIFGVGASVGTFYGGRIADRFHARALLVMLPLQLIGWTAIAASSAYPIAIGIAMFIFGGVMFMPGSAIVNRVISGAAKAPDLASVLVSSAANIGIAVGAIIGARALSSGLDYSQLPWIGAFFAALAVGIIAVSLMLEKREISHKSK